MLEFGGTEQGEITFSVAPDGSATFVRGEVTATTSIYVTDIISVKEGDIAVTLSANAEDISVATASALVALFEDERFDVNNKTYSLNETINNLAASEPALIEYASSYTLSDTVESVMTLTVKAANLLKSSTNPGGYVYSISDTIANATNTNFSVEPWISVTSVRLTGSDGAQKVVGTIFDDVIAGGPGVDTITPHKGNDIIVYDSIENDGRDLIVKFTTKADGENFNEGFDLLQFSGADIQSMDNFKSYQGNNTKLEIGDDVFIEFVSGEGPQTASSGGAALLFNQSTYRLSIDVDGTGDGGAIEIAVLHGVKDLSIYDFLIVA